VSYLTKRMSEESREALLRLTNIREITSSSTLEALLSSTLNLSPGRVSIVTDIEDGEVQFIVFPDAESESPKDVDGEALAKKLNLLPDAFHCDVIDVDDSEDEFIDEETAFKLWREQTDRTSHLPPFPSPDGEMIVPSHHPSLDSTMATGDAIASPTESQLKRDPTLLEFDNVERIPFDDPRIRMKDTWGFPFIITGISAATTSDLLEQTLIEKFKETEVRTGNRETLANNGFVNSLPLSLIDALSPSSGFTDHPECGRIVFSPVQELPPEFRAHLLPLTCAFPEDGGGDKNFTLTLAREGFGIGFHKHNAAMFMLVVGRKKWYLGPESVEDDPPTHPDFYTTKSSHKCIQQPGEVLHVPTNWFHEIFNLDRYTAGVQALPA